MIIDSLPHYYKNSVFIQLFSEAIRDEDDLFLQYFEESKKEFFVNSCSSAILDWEREFRVPSYISQDIQTRRGNVLGRLRGYGIANKDFIKKVVEGFYKGESVDITEDHDNYLVTMYFKTLKTFPVNYEELQRSLEELLPCHLDYAYKFDFALNNYTHAELEQYEHIVLEGATHGG